MELKKTLRNILCFSTLFMGISAAQADLLQDIKDKGEIVIATEARYAPFEMLENGKIVGYGKDILDEILKDLPGVKLKQLDLPFQGILAGLNSKRYDFVATSLMITQRRMDHYAFTNPIADASVAILNVKMMTASKNLRIWLEKLLVLRRALNSLPRLKRMKKRS